MSRDFSSMGVAATQQDSAGNSLDYEALKVAIRATQEKKVAALDAQTEQTVVGIVSSINYIGKHEMKGKAEIKSDEELRKLLTEHPDLEIINENGKRFYEFDMKAGGYVQVNIDVPQAMVDFGDKIGVKPMRISMNGERWIPALKSMVVNNPYQTKETTKDFEATKEWSLGKKNGLYKLAVATGVINSNQPFKAADVGKLLGKAAMFTVMARFNDKGYYEERIKNASPLMRGLPVPEYDNGLLSMIVGFNYSDGAVLESDVEVITKSTAVSIVNSLDYEGSRLQKDFGEIISRKAGNSANNDNQSEGSGNDENSQEKGGVSNSEEKKVEQPKVDEKVTSVSDNTASEDDAAAMFV